MNTYTATVTHEDGAWLAECVEDPTAHTWAHTLTKLRENITEAILVSADLPDDSTINVRLVPGSELSEEVARALELGNQRVDLKAAEAQLRAETLASVHSLSSSGYSVRDIAAAVGLTPGRVAQLASA